jgi:hypothetical protein
MSHLKSPAVQITLFSAIAVLFTSCSAIFSQSRQAISQGNSVEAPINPNTQKQNQILGKWAGSSRCEESGTTLVLQGVFEYLSSSGSYFEGDLSLSQPYQGQIVQITYAVRAIGEWSIEGDQFTEKTNDLKSSVKSLKMNDIEIDAQQIDAATLKQIPKLETVIPKGVMSDSTLVSVTRENMTLRVNSGACKGVITDYKRQK